MKASIAIAVAALFAAGSAFAQSAQPQNTKAPAKVAPQQIAQAGGGMATGAGGATGGAVGTGWGATPGGVPRPGPPPPPPAPRPPPPSVPCCEGRAGVF